MRIKPTKKTTKKKTRRPRTWEDAGTRTCPKCGQVWALKKMKVAMRDKDSLECVCGRTIIEWNGGVMYLATKAEPERRKVKKP